MEQEKVCGICGRSYEPDLLAMHLTLAKDSQTEPLYDYDICLRCTYKLGELILAIQLTRPKKCEFCQFERGPRVAKLPECEECSNFKNFQLKKRMSPRQAYEWDKYKRYLCEGEQQ